MIIHCKDCLAFYRVTTSTGRTHPEKHVLCPFCGSRELATQLNGLSTWLANWRELWVLAGVLFGLSAIGCIAYLLWINLIVRPPIR